MKWPLQPKPQPPEPAPESDYRVLDEDEVLVEHRWRNLMGLGFSMDQILRMRIGRRSFDWHEADELLKAGQNHEQVTWRLED